MTLEKARNTIIQALNHTERRQIINILKHQPEGTRYTAILGETQLTTAKLNYQLNELHLLIEKTEDGQYILTDLGTRAAAILENIDSNLSGDIELQPIIDDDSRERLKRGVDRVFTVIMAMYVAVPLLMTVIIFAKPSTDIPLPMLGFLYLMVGVTLIGVNYARKAAPHVIYSLYEFFYQIFKGTKQY